MDLREFRKEHNLTQSELATMLKTSQQNVHNWETNVHKQPRWLEGELINIKVSLKGKKENE